MKPILIIDCDPDFRRLLSQLLQREGYLVIQASNLTINLSLAEDLRLIP